MEGPRFAGEEPFSRMALFLCDYLEDKVGVPVTPQLTPDIRNNSMVYSVYDMSFLASSFVLPAKDLKPKIVS